MIAGTIKTWEAITAKQQLADLKQYQEIKAEQATILTNQIRCEYCGQVGHLARDCILKRCVSIGNLKYCIVIECMNYEP